MYRTTLAFCLALVASALAIPPTTAAAQDTATRMSTVTEQYSFEELFPAMSSEGISTTRQMAEWYVSAAQSFKDRSAAIKKQIDLHREAKKAEIKALEARAEAAGKMKDDATKKKLQAAAKEQKLELEILDSVKKLSDNEASIADQYQTTGEAFQKLADAYDNLTRTRESAVKDYEKMAEAAAKEDLPAPMPTVNYDLNQKALEALADAGEDLRRLGERMEKVSRAREELLKKWEKAEKR